MNEVLKAVTGRVAAASRGIHFLDFVFGTHKEEACGGRPVVLFGAGDFGRELCLTLRLRGVEPVAFCDNDPSRAGNGLCGLPVLSFEALLDAHRESLIVIANRFHGATITEQLMRAGIPADCIRCKPSDLGNAAGFFYLYAINSTVSVQATNPTRLTSEEMLVTLERDALQVQQVYDLLSDAKSRELYLMRLALMVSDEHFELFQQFLGTFSEPILEFGPECTSMKTEEHYYFNHEVLNLAEGEIYIDCGAADGDTVETFVEACRRRSVHFDKIFAFEPDPDNFKALLQTSKQFENVHCHNKGLWSSTTCLRFVSSRQAIHNEAGTIADAGDIEIQVTSIDDFLDGDRVSLIKLDPGGDIISGIIRGASRSIARHQPKVVAGVYHSLESLYRIPLLIHDIRPDCHLYLRHNAYHANETHLYAV